MDSGVAVDVDIGAEPEDATPPFGQLFEFEEDALHHQDMEGATAVVAADTVELLQGQEAVPVDIGGFMGEVEVAIDVLVASDIDEFP